jgi:glycosyltransferase involved in cell wall biosynthesis
MMRFNLDRYYFDAIESPKQGPILLRILTLSYEFPPLGGGGSKVVRGLSAEFVRMGHEVEVVSMGFEDLPRTETVDGAIVHRIPCIRKAVDVSHPHELASYMFRAMPAALRIGRGKKFDIIHCHFILPDGLVGIWLSRKLGMPIAVTAHGSDVPGYNPDRFKLLHRLIAPVWRAAVRSIDRIICPSRFLEKLIHEHESAVSTVAIPNGLDLDKFDATKVRKRSILVVTRMLERKGVQDVLRALAGTDLGFEINIVGTGPYLDALLKLADELDVDARFHGWLDNDSIELKELFETSSIFAFPSHTENFPLVLLEAMAAGLAIITTNQTGCCEVVGDTAIQVDPGDDRAILRAVELLASDENERSRLGVAARQRLDEFFSWQAVAQRYIGTFEELISVQRESDREAESGRS